MLHAGIDLGSKTVKLVVLDDGLEVLYSSYERHLSNVFETLAYTLKNASVHFPCEAMTFGVTGSAGMQLAELLGLPFTQEVVSVRSAIKTLIPQTDTAIEIGGEDSKILFLTGGEELRMNSTCAGGTGGFIDTIAGMLDMNAEQLNYCAHGCKNILPIASRCAVFAQADVRPLINQGVSKEDIAGSAFDAVVAQCVGGLACGRPIVGNVAFLGGPLHFLSALRERFIDRLGLDSDHVVVPREGHLFVAQGAALAQWHAQPSTLSQMVEKINGIDWRQGASLPRLDPLFGSKEEFEAFSKRHASHRAPRTNMGAYEGEAFLGIDSGSEAIKYALIAKDGSILRTYYARSAGNLIEAARDMLLDLWKHIPRMHDGSPAITIARSLVTGYGENYLRQALRVDAGEVETVCHMRAAQSLSPDANFILDIGGQDIKCIYLRNGSLDNVVLNEACSSGCGALLSGMAWSMNVRFDRFLDAALFASEPVDLGTRCTVFMTSRVRHAQKEGATIGDISAGLAYSVVRNAVFKVMRVRDFAALGKHVVVQGGTFLNDAVLRAFEKLSGIEVVRPDIAGHMGAYGAALLAREQHVRGKGESACCVSELLSLEQLKRLQLTVRTETCKLCGNHCSITVTTFESDGETRELSVGNRCARGDRSGAKSGIQFSDYYSARVRRAFTRAARESSGARGSIGVMRTLEMFDLFPFWDGVLSDLDFDVVLSSERAKLRGAALGTIPSESACFPSKIVHAHALDLVNRRVAAIFAPSVREVMPGELSCPPSRGVPFVLKANVEEIGDGGVPLAAPVLEGLFSSEDFDVCADVAVRLLDALRPIALDLSLADIEHALVVGSAAQRAFRDDIARMGKTALAAIRQRDGRGIVLAGRPYHGDPEIGHGIAGLLRECGFAVLTEDMLLFAEGPLEAEASNLSGWLYPDRVLNAAQATIAFDNLEFMELYSFGCGLDALTVDRARDIVEGSGKVFTALKIDEMVDLASIRIRVRSMIAAHERRSFEKRGLPEDDGKK